VLASDLVQFVFGQMRMHLVQRGSEGFPCFSGGPARYQLELPMGCGWTYSEPAHCFIPLVAHGSSLLFRLARPDPVSLTNLLHCPLYCSIDLAAAFFGHWRKLKMRCL
jgi:hypothetical protein